MSSSGQYRHCLWGEVVWVEGVKCEQVIVRMGESGDDTEKGS